MNKLTYFTLFQKPTYGLGGKKSRNLFTGEYPVFACATNVNGNMYTFTTIPMDKKPIKEKRFFFERGQSSAAEKIEGMNSFYDRGQISAEK